METSSSIVNISSALLKVQRELKPVVKDATNPFVKNRYATLNAVIEACLEKLNDAGVLLMQAPVEAPERCGSEALALETRLTHVESGEWVSSKTVIPILPKAIKEDKQVVALKPDPQGMGSAITYARRYALMAMLGMTADDDDAELAMQRPDPQPQYDRRPEPPRQVQQPRNGGLPNLQGVSFVDGNINGQPAIIATGKEVYNNRDALKQFGFKYNPNSKAWWKPNGNGYQEPSPQLDEVPFS